MINALMADSCEVWFNVDGGADPRGNRIPVPTLVGTFPCYVKYSTSETSTYGTTRQDVWFYLPPAMEGWRTGAHNKVGSNFIKYRGRTAQASLAAYVYRAAGRTHYVKVPITWVA